MDYALKVQGEAGVSQRGVRPPPSLPLEYVYSSLGSFFVALTRDVSEALFELLDCRSEGHALFGTDVKVEALVLLNGLVEVTTSEETDEEGKEGS